MVQRSGRLDSTAHHDPRGKTASLVGIILLPVCLVFRLSGSDPVHLVFKKSRPLTRTSGLTLPHAEPTFSVEIQIFVENLWRNIRILTPILSESVLPALWFNTVLLRSCINVSSISNCYYLYKNINSTFNHRCSNGY